MDLETQFLTVAHRPAIGSIIDGKWKVGWVRKLEGKAGYKVYACRVDPAPAPANTPVVKSNSQNGRP